jgi:propionate CoA-transferase
VPSVEHVTFAGARALRTGQDVLYVTERCVMRLTEGGLVATEIMPGIEPARDIVAASEGRVRVAENATVLPATLLRDAPMGMTL